MTSAVEFLAGSRNRVRLLEALAEGPATQDALTERFDVSRTTLWRLVGGMSDRGWVDERDDKRFALTTKGRLVANAYTAFEETATAIERLDDLLAHLPIAEYSFDVGCLVDAEVTKPEKHNPQAPLYAAAAPIPGSGRIRSVSRSWSRYVFDRTHTEVVDGACQVEMVVTDGVVEMIKTDEEAREQLLEMYGTGRTEVRHHRGQINHIVGIIDETVVLGVDDEAGSPQGSLTVCDEAVHKWAVAAFDRDWEAATPLTASDFERA